MKMTKIHIIAVFIAACTFGLLGCDHTPLDKIINPGTTTSGGAWSGTWVIYDNEVKTGGATMMFNTMEGQDLSFACAENPHAGSHCVKFSWDGSTVVVYSTSSSVANTSGSSFVGFSLIAAASTGDYNNVSKDLTGGAYTKLSFWARGSLNSNVYLRVEANSDDPSFYRLASGQYGVWMGTVGSSWQKYEIPLDSTRNKLSTVRDFVKIILRYDEDGNPDTANTRQGCGGTVYIDDIQLTR